MDNLATKITDSELEIMKYLWKQDKEVTMAEIRKGLQLRSNWDSSTIKTLLYRLCDKGAVKSIKRDVFYYCPLINKDEYKEFITQSLINKLYSGSAKNLIASLMGNHNIPSKDLEELKEMFKVGEKDE